MFAKLPVWAQSALAVAAGAALPLVPALFDGEPVVTLKSMARAAVSAAVAYVLLHTKVPH